MHKKFSLLLVIVMILAGLTACASSKTGQTGSAIDLAGVDESMQLIVGTLLLDGSENEISTDEAIELLPLWQLYSTLSNSDTAAIEEVNAVVTQIKNVMNDTQIVAIEDFDLVGQNAMILLKDSGLMEQLGFNPTEKFALGGELPDGFEKPQSGDDGETRPLGADFPKGGLPGGGTGGGIPGGRLGSGDGSGVDPSLLATKMAESGKTVPANRNTQMFLQLLISYLENKVAK